MEIAILKKQFFERKVLLKLIILIIGELFKNYFVLEPWSWGMKRLGLSFLVGKLVGKIEKLEILHLASQFEQCMSDNGCWIVLENFSIRTVEFFL